MIKIVLDPGHGGKSIGTKHYRLKEKDLALKYAQSLKMELEKNKKYQVILTRNKDIFVSFLERIQLAADADLFLSIHADGLDLPALPLIEIFTYSKTASTTKANKIAQIENAADYYNTNPEITLSAINSSISKTKKQKNAEKKFVKLLSSYLVQQLNYNLVENHSANFIILKNSAKISALIQIHQSNITKSQQAIINAIHEFF